MTDSDLLMVENLTYFTTDQLQCAGATKSIEQCDSIGEFLDQFDEEALSNLDSGDVDNQEWAARIRYMKSNQEIKTLVVKEYNPDVKCLLFEDPNNPNHAIVSFRGTSGGDEWIDNVEGLNRADTEAQLKTKEYIDSLGYDSITVTGHSKGGNKAMYVAITCDKVDRCVAYDGQGFSKEFIDKYSVKIQERASKVKNYSLSNDYVHILMFPIPGSEQIYMEPGNRVDKIGGAHYPIGPFRLYEIDGKWYIDESDGIIHITSSEDPAMTILHNFTTFAMNNMSPEELENTVEFVSLLLAGLFTESDFNIGDYVNSNKEGVIKLLAYLLRYLKDNNMGIDELIQISESIGIPKDKLYEIIGESMGVPAWVAEKALPIVFDNITDGDEDSIIHFLIGAFAGDNAEMISAWWRQIENEYTNIHPTAGTANYESIIRDYSVNVYNAIIRAIDSFESNALPDVTSWNGYSGESWFSRLLISSAIRCINGYKKKLYDINSECKRRVNTVFDSIESLDETYSRRIDTSVSTARTLSYQIQQV